MVKLNISNYEIEVVVSSCSASESLFGCPVVASMILTDSELDTSLLATCGAVDASGCGMTAVAVDSLLAVVVVSGLC